jgi:hypothetical protein
VGKFIILACRLLEQTQRLSPSEKFGLKMKDFKYIELRGADHGTVITQSMPAPDSTFFASARFASA